MIIDGIERRVTLLGENAHSNTVPRLRELLQHRHLGGAEVRRRVIGAHRIDRDEDDVGVRRARHRRRAGTRRARSATRIVSRSNSASIASPASGRSPQIASVSDGCARHAITAHATISAATTAADRPRDPARPRPRAPREVREQQRDQRERGDLGRARYRADRAALSTRSARTATPTASSATDDLDARAWSA